MERRHAKRNARKLHAKVYLDSQSKCEASTLNVCRNGLYLQVRDAGLVPNKIVNVRLEDSGFVKPWRGRAMVVRASSSGVGMLLEKDLPPAFYRG